MLRFLCLFLVISNGWAQSPYLIETLDFSRSISLEQAIDKLQGVALKPKHLVSLGESHLHPFTTRAVQEIFVDAYLESAQDYRFCSESIKDFLKHSAGIKLSQSATSTIISENNSPNITDFRSCKKAGVDSYFTYSGFFHQLPFARPFPLEFTPTPVITEDGENIRDQLNIKNNFFLIQMELEYVELVTQAHLLRKVPATTKDFRAKVDLLISKVQEAKNAQELIFEAAVATRTKVGVVLNHEGFSDLPSGAHLLLTDLKYRKELKPLPLLRGLLKLSDAALDALLGKLRRDPVYITAAIQEPDVNGNLYQTGYGTVPWLFPPNSTFMELRIAPGENVIITADPLAQKTTCIAYKELGPSVVDCDEYLQDIP